MVRRLVLSVSVCILLIALVFIGCSERNLQPKIKGGLEIHTWTYALGSVNDTDLEKTILSYSLNLTNNNHKEVLIKFLQPLIGKSIKNRVISKELKVNVNRNVKPNQTIEVKGSIVIDTKGMSKVDIDSLRPFITDVKVSTEEIIALKQSEK